MASSSSAVKDSVILTEDDIPGASLAGRNPSSLKNEELREWPGILKFSQSCGFGCGVVRIPL